MDLDFAIADFDGSLGNPVILTSALLVALIIAIFLASAVRYAGRQAWIRALIALAVAIATSIGARPIARILAAGYLTIVGAPHAGFIGGFPWWFCPLIAIAITPLLLISARFRRR